MKTTKNYENYKEALDFENKCKVLIELLSVTLYNNTNIPIQIQQYKYINTNIAIQIYQYNYINTNRMFSFESWLGASPYFQFFPPLSLIA